MRIYVDILLHTFQPFILVNFSLSDGVPDDLEAKFVHQSGAQQRVNESGYDGILLKKFKFHYFLQRF